MPRKALLLLIFPLFSLSIAAARETTASDSAESVSPTAVISELNRARENPAAYASYLEEYRSHFDGNLLLVSGVRIRTSEGTKAVDEAIRFLRSTKPLQPLAVSPGMCKSAADHCADLAGGRFEHRGSDGSNPGVRMNRYGTWGTLWGENISCGKRTARDIALQLIIDDGLRARKHRKNIFNRNFNFAGAAYGTHARYGSICNIDFAAAYNEHGGTLVAHNP